MAYWACPAPDCGKLYTCKSHCKRHHGKKHKGEKFPEKDEAGNLHNLLTVGIRGGIAGNASSIAQQPQPPGGQPQAMSTNVTAAEVPTTQRITRAVPPDQTPFPPPNTYNSFQSPHTDSLSYGNYPQEDPAMLRYRCLTAPSPSFQPAPGLDGLAHPANFANFIQLSGAMQAGNFPQPQTQAHRWVQSVDGHTHAPNSGQHVDDAPLVLSNSVNGYGRYTEQGTPLVQQQDPNNMVDFLAESSAGGDGQFSSYHRAGPQGQY